MRFREFWPLYLNAHRLPGTRALHYFATALGILSAIQAVAAQQAWIFVAGIALSYAIAISAHWFVERNQPLIGVSVFWGAVADLRMCWLALTGRMEIELIRRGVVAQATLEPVASHPVRTTSPTADVLHNRKRFDAQHLRYSLLIASTAGLTVGLSDLSDLSEAMHSFRHPIIQLGAPIVAFAGALIAAFAAIVAAQRYAAALSTGTPLKAASRGGSGANERSLRRACMALLAFGSLAFGLAELAEHGLPNPAPVYGAIAGLATLLCVGVAMVWHVATVGQPSRVAEVIAGDFTNIAGPATKGLRVDGRVRLVDLLENSLSFGRRRAILAATLDAARLGPGDSLADVGCGTGELTLMAAALAADHAGTGIGTTTGIDATPGMIEVARLRAREAGSTAQFELALAEALPLPDRSVDVVTSTFFFHHLPSEVKPLALREMWRVLKPGGRLVITDYGWARGLVGLVASFPMRFNFHEYVRPQLDGELERIIAAEGLGEPETVHTFLGYIRVLRIAKAAPRR
ncbi:MAG TPA: methyltransferase domain-containing protein [Dongiaceae bacterium]|nr:methyltransferase domain-containing protein [Dongiaceae bacterium]